MIISPQFFIAPLLVALFGLLKENRYVLWAVQVEGHKKDGAPGGAVWVQQLLLVMGVFRQAVVFPVIVGNLLHGLK